MVGTVHIGGSNMKRKIKFTDEVKEYNSRYRITGTVLTVTVDQEQRRYSVVLLDQNNNMIQVAVQNAYGYENIKRTNKEIRASYKINTIYRTTNQMQ